jgi:hypothetical protein
MRCRAGVDLGARRPTSIATGRSPADARRADFLAREIARWRKIMAAGRISIE